MKTTLANWSTQSSIVLVLQQFLAALSGPVNRTTIREAVMASPQFPVVSLNDINEILRSWQFETTVFNAQPHWLNQLDGPLLAHCNWHDGDSYFVVILRVENELVYYFSPFAGDVVEPITEFAQHWQGLLLNAALVGQDASRLWEGVDRETITVQRYQRESMAIYDDFIPSEVCQYVIRYTEEQTRLDRSKVEASGGGFQHSSGRTGSSVTLKNRQDAVFQIIYQRVANWLGVPQKNIETLQCVRYGEGQQCKPHYDVNTNNRPLHTLLLYLNDDFEGGETFFPELNIKVKSAQGRVLHFLNCDEANQILLQAIHAELPIQRGVKYACTMWVHDNLIV